MTIKVLTLNLWLGGKMFDEILQFLEAQDADIVLLQEAYNGEDPALERRFRSMQVLRQTLGYPHEDFVADYRDFDHVGGKAQRGNAILSKFPIISRRKLYFNESYSETYRDVPGNYEHCPRDLQHVVLQTPVGEVNVYNIQGVWDLNGDNYSPRRRKMAETVLQLIEGRANVILGGDTNAQQTNQAILDLERRLKSVFARDLTTTFNMRHKDNPGYATAAVDAILVSPQITVIRRICHKDDLSDHLALSAELAIPEKLPA